jgi:hypothetical protein
MDNDTCKTAEQLDPEHEYSLAEALSDVADMLPVVGLDVRVGLTELGKGLAAIGAGLRELADSLSMIGGGNE